MQKQGEKNTAAVESPDVSSVPWIQGLARNNSLQPWVQGKLNPAQTCLESQRVHTVLITPVVRKISRFHISVYGEFEYEVN